MEERSYGIRVVLDTDVETAEARVREALAGQGFGILSEIDIAAALKEKIDVDRPAYKILGACNPPLANRALQADEEIGLLLPCNVVVYTSDEGTVVEAMDPGIMGRITDAEGIDAIAAEARERLVAALAALD